MYLNSVHFSKVRYVIKRAFGKYLLATNAISSGILMGLGDGAEQLIELKANRHPTGTFNWKRITHMTIVGLLIGVPQHYFYSVLTAKLPGSNLNTVIKKIFIDQLIASPGTIIIFFFGLNLLENGNFSSGYEELSRKFLSIYVMDWMFWPPTQFINFSFVPPKYTVIYVNGMTMLYDVLLSYMKFIHNPDDIKSILSFTSSPSKSK